MVGNPVMKMSSLAVKAVDGGLPFLIFQHSSDFKRHDMSLSSCSQKVGALRPGKERVVELSGRGGNFTSVEEPVNWPFGVDVLVIPDEVDLLPDIAEESIDMAVTQIIGPVEPVGAKNTHLQLRGRASLGGVQSVDKGSPVVPLKVVDNIAELVLDDVEVAAIGPVVPEVDYLEYPAVIHQENGVKLERPWDRNGVLFMAHAHPQTTKQ